jgi:hypothetical protein
MNRGEPERVAGFEARHAAILARTLRWADDAAARRDYAQAVHWIETVRGLGHDLPTEYEAKRERWLNARDHERQSGG